MFISVIITAYNRREFVGKAIRSVMQQTLAKECYEIIVIKNFRDDSICDLAESGEIVVIDSNSDTLGEFLLAGIRKARGEVICFLDDDDIYSETKLEQVRFVFQKYTKVAFLHNAYKYFTGSTCNDEQTSPTSLISTFGMANCTVPQMIRNADIASRNLSSISIRLAPLSRYLSLIGTLPASPDSFVFLAAFESGMDLAITPNVLTHYRIHSSAIHSFGGYAQFVAERKRVLRIFIDSADQMLSMFRSTCSQVVIKWWLYSLISKMSILDGDFNRRTSFRERATFMRIFAIRGGPDELYLFINSLLPHYFAPSLSRLYYMLQRASGRRQKKSQ